MQLGLAIFRASPITKHLQIEDEMELLVAHGVSHLGLRPIMVCRYRLGFPNSSKLAMISSSQARLFAVSLNTVILVA
jgi:hypothetical protein